jgi:hypothetical protein
LFGARDEERLFVHGEPQKFGLDLFRQGGLDLICGFFDFKPDDGQWRSKFMRYLSGVTLQLMKRQADLESNPLICSCSSRNSLSSVSILICTWKLFGSIASN